jgi:hypothetical protein
VSASEEFMGPEKDGGHCRRTTWQNHCSHPIAIGQRKKSQPPDSGENPQPAETRTDPLAPSLPSALFHVRKAN